uniref:ZP domain-containing protein n=1 Tax=Parascaris univalens TaxID=6257 RepID=A0A915AI10_PARUN
EFILNIRFDEPFYGIIYSEKGYPNCVYVNASIVSQVSYSVRVPLDGCETSLNAEGNLENAVVIQESGTHVQPSDKKYLLTCIPAASSTRESFAMVNFGGIMVEGGATTSETVRARGSGQETKYTVLLLSTDNGAPLDPLFSP